MNSIPLDPTAKVHETAVVDEGAVLGPEVRVWHFVHVSTGARVGAGTVLGQGVYVGPGVSIGRDCKVQNHVSVYEGVTLEDEVFVGPSAVFTNVKHPRAHVSRKGEFDPTLVKRHATIGANAVIVCGVTVGERAFVAAGAVVTKDVPPGALVAGCPAQTVAFACACGERLPGGDPPWTCARCGASWTPASGGGVEPTKGG